MKVNLNNKQGERLADFFLDMAKGLLLGGIGFSAVVPLESKLVTVFLSSGLSFWCLKMGLSLLEE